MLLLIPKPLQNINKSMLGICCKDSGADEFGIYWICPQSEGIRGYISHFCNSREKYEVPGMQNIPNSQKSSLSFKKESWFGGLIWILRRKESKEKAGNCLRMIQIFHSHFLKACFKVNLKWKCHCEMRNRKCQCENRSWNISNSLNAFLIFFFPLTEATYDILTWSCDKLWLT